MRDLAGCVVERIYCDKYDYIVPRTRPLLECAFAASDVAAV